ncbi:hypothetical protein O181_064316 [Austropuccinia psidii MF-1]|uniref:Reverse transcriptase Ty1/copia-type domain-containing protein n=1 Tax=Austropuccinia psidii MF-1 TaxID=1389203 RepID=A0A9Q3ETF9_9BASI|nr:hypothetical protein [Austropuccinia psidii MF-1]
MTQGAQTVDEIGPALSEVVDEIHPDLSCNPMIVSPRQEQQDSLVDEVQDPFPKVEARPHQQIRPLALLTSNNVIPKTFKSVLSSPDKDLLLVAINKELESMNALDVWDVIELDPLFKLVGTTWVFKIKKDHLGRITEYKARLCAQGFTQSAGVDFNQTYAPTGWLNSLRTLIAFSAERDLEFHQIDIKSAFLNAPLSETVYLGIPQGLSIDRRAKCLRLQKAIYGLKQAPLAWYDCLK